MPNDDGIAGPLPERHARPIERTADLDAGRVNESITETLRSRASGLDRWVDAVGERASKPGMPKYAEFQAPRGSALGEVESVFEKAVGHDEGKFGAFKAVGGVFETALMRPTAGLTDAYQVAEIRELQQKFFENQGGRLTIMDSYERKAKKAMRDLSNLLDTKWKSGIDTSYPRKLLDQKAQVGNDVASDIADALANTDDPDERSQLQALQKDFQNWTTDRDQRVGKEQSEMRTLTDRADGLNSEILRQIGAMYDAGNSLGPGNTTGANGAFTDTSHVAAAAVTYMKGLRDFMLGSRGRFDRVLGGPQQ